MSFLKNKLNFDFEATPEEIEKNSNVETSYNMNFEEFKRLAFRKSLESVLNLKRICIERNTYLLNNSIENVSFVKGPKYDNNCSYIVEKFQIESFVNNFLIF